MKGIQRLVSLILALVMVVGMLPPLPARSLVNDLQGDSKKLLDVVSLQSEESASGSCGDNLTWSFEDGVLTISGSGDMYDWWTYEKDSEKNWKPTPWYDYLDNILHVVVEAGVTSIGDCAFYYCRRLIDVSLPSSVAKIGMYAFGECYSLNNFELPEELIHIGNSAFYNCFINLTEITIPESVTYIGESAFYQCNALTSVILPEGLTSINDYTFAACYSLTDINIPSSVTHIGIGAFADCITLPTVTLPKGITQISAMAFYDCYELTSIVIPESVTSIGDDAFFCCHALSSITIPQSVAEIGTAFFECDDLKEVIFTGSAPQFDEETFGHVTATAYYPSDNDTWTEEVKQNYGGTITWMPYSEVPGVLTESYLIEQISKGVMEIQLTEDLIVENTLVLPANIGLTVSEGCTITIKQKTTIAGVLTIDNGAKLIVDGELRCVNGGTINVAGEYEFVSDSEEERYVVRDCQEGKNVTINGIDTKDQKLIAKFDYYIEEEIGNYYTNQELTDILNNDNYGAYDIIVGEAEENGWQYETLVIPETCHLTVYLWAKNCTDEWTIPERSTVINKGHITIQSTSGIMVSGTFVNQGSVDCNGLIALHGGTFVNEGKVNIHPGGGVKESGGTWQGSEPVRVCENPCENEQYLIKQHSDGTYSYWLDTDIVLENDFTVTKELHIYDFYTVTIPAGKTLIVDGFLINCRGTIVVESGGTLVVNGYLAFRELGKLTVKSGGNLVINDYLECSGASVLNVEGNYEIGTNDGKKCYVELQKSWEWYYSGNEINGIASEDIFLDTTVSNANDLRELLETTSYGKANINLQVYDKDFVLDCDITIPKNYELVDWWGMIISDNCTVTNNGILRIDGSLKNDGVIKLNENSGFINTEGEIINNSIIYVYDGSEFFSDYKFQNNGTVYAYEGCKLKVSEDYWEGNAPIEVETSGWCGDKLKWMFDAPVGTLTISGSGNMWNFTISLKQKSANPMVPWAFCQSEIKKVVLSEGVTSVGNNAFAGCTQLTEVTLPKSITAIGEAAFQNSGLKEITFQGDAPEVSESAFQGVSATVLYPQENETWTDDKKQDFGGDLTWDEPEDDHDGKLGDVNHDNKINAKDATLILQKSVGVLKETAKFCEDCAEVSGDGKLNAKDSTLILQFSVGLRETFPAEQ